MEKKDQVEHLLPAHHTTADVVSACGLNIDLANMVRGFLLPNASMLVSPKSTRTPVEFDTRDTFGRHVTFKEFGVNSKGTHILLAFQSSQSCIRVFDLNMNRITQTVNIRGDFNISVKWLSPWMFAIVSMNSVSVWNVDNGECVATLRGHFKTILGVCNRRSGALESMILSRLVEYTQEVGEDMKEAVGVKVEDIETITVVATIAGSTVVWWYPRALITHMTDDAAPNGHRSRWPEWLKMLVSLPAVPTQMLQTQSRGTIFRFNNRRPIFKGFENMSPYYRVHKTLAAPVMKFKKLLLCNQQRTLIGLMIKPKRGLVVWDLCHNVGIGPFVGAPVHDIFICGSEDDKLIIECGPGNIRVLEVGGDDKLSLAIVLSKKLRAYENRRLVGLSLGGQLIFHTDLLSGSKSGPPNLRTYSDRIIMTRINHL